MLQTSRVDIEAAYHFQPGADPRLLVLCDHAGHAMAADHADLGIDPRDRLGHVAWDPGAQGVAQALAAALDCPAFHGVYSRLLVDLNRAPDAGDLIVFENDGVRVPGNLEVGHVERELRIERYHRPYHRAIDAHLRELEAQGVRPLVVSVHSFAPVLHGRTRPWPVGILWKRDGDWLRRVFEGLRAQGLDVGDNHPYDGRAALGYSLEHHVLPRGLPHVLFEIRQDLLEHADDQQAWSRRLLAALRHAGLPGA
jgi:predicted N-formylglutamate amidohydrolase